MEQKVLVVDDELGIRELLHDALTEAGYEVITARSGKEAIEVFRTKKPDLVLLDIMMPELDGFQTCEILRKDSNNASLPIIMLTAKDRESDIVQALELGADDYIIKPVDAKELLNKIDNLLSIAKTGMLPSQLYFEKLESEEKTNKEKQGDNH